jgi:dihydroxyacetone kinase-like protein
MTDTIGYSEVGRMIDAAAAIIRENHELLSKLDSATGDGDHGTSMLRAAEAMETSVKEDSSDELKSLLHAVGWAVMSIDGGSTGPLLGSFFMGLSEGAAEAKSLDTPAMAAMFEAGLAKMQKQSKAQVGDKTMMDALIPAIEALRSAADEGKDIQTAMDGAANAAAKGTEATAEMQAKFGRARNLGERTIGHIDPGATSMSLFFKAFSRSCSA